jgi:hypothetical protein
VRMKKLVRIRKNVKITNIYRAEAVHDIFYPVICAVVNDLNFLTTAKIMGKHLTVTVYRKAIF